MKQISTFLGANTPNGFSSLFDELYNPYEKCRAYIIKGGPGTGKSSFMKKVAKAAAEKGFDCELVYCSSDPKSLDGVIIPELKLCIADGTSPHVVEPKFPGACENILNLGQFWDEKKLYKKSEEIRSLTVENSLYHRRSTLYLSAAGAIYEDIQKLLTPFVDRDKAEGFAFRFAQREIPKKKNVSPGKKKRRYMSAVSPEGLIYLDETVKALASRVIGIEDEYGIVAPLIAERIGEIACGYGYDVIFCRCPMRRKDETEHVIIPEIGLCVMSVRSEHRTKILPDRLIHCSRFVDMDKVKLHRNRAAYSKKTANELTAKGVDLLKSAKSVHDELEKCYIDAMDFAKLDKYTERFIKNRVICAK